MRPDVEVAKVLVNAVIGQVEICKLRKILGADRAGIWSFKKKTCDPLLHGTKTWHVTETTIDTAYLAIENLDI
jgi:hypothetical protein